MAKPKVLTNNVPVLVDDETKAWLDDRAARCDLSRGDVIREAIRRAMSVDEAVESMTDPA